MENKVNVGFVLYGFLNDYHSLNNLKYAQDICKNILNFKVNFYYAIPNQLSEFLKQKIDIEKIKSIVGDNFNYTIVDYNVCKYIQDCTKLQYNLITDEHKMYPARTFSMFDRIKDSVQLLKNFKIKNDLCIVTRLNFLPSVHFLTNIYLNDINNKLFIFRTCPYKSNSQAEDRFFWGDQNKIELLTEIYDYISNKIYDDKNFFNEYMLADFFITKNINGLEYQDNIFIETKINQAKYNEDTRNKMINYYKECESVL